MVIRKYKLSTYAETKRLIGTGDDLPEPLLFREKLYAFNEQGRRIGRFSLNIDQDDTDLQTSTPHKVLHVHISNRAFIGNRLTETTVTGSVTSKLKTLEEIRYEVTEICEGNKHERCLFLLRETTKYYLSVTTTICDFNNRNHTTIPFVDAIGLIGEASNALLLRKLAFQGYEGILCLKGLLSNGKRCKNYYVTKLSERIINGKRMQVLIVYRTMTNHKKCNITMTMALTRAGQLIYLFWSNSKCFLHVDPDAELNTNYFKYGNPQLHKNWHKDIQLHSLYLDRVDYQLTVLRSYNNHREELRRVFDDFIEYLLLLKPKDVVCSAIEYFSAFGKDTLRKCDSKTRKKSDFHMEYAPSFGVFTTGEEEEPVWADESVFFGEYEPSFRTRFTDPDVSNKSRTEDSEITRKRRSEDSESSSGSRSDQSDKSRGSSRLRGYDSRKSVRRKSADVRRGSRHKSSDSQRGSKHKSFDSQRGIKRKSRDSRKESRHLSSSK